MSAKLKMAQGVIKVIPLGPEHEGKTNFEILGVSPDISHVKPGDRGSAYRHGGEISLIKNDTMLIGNCRAEELLAAFQACVSSYSYEFEHE